MTDTDKPWHVSKGEPYYIVRWYDKRKERWYKSTSAERPTREYAEKQLAQDIGYFWDDIDIELVEINETVLKVVKGGQRRGK